MQSKEWLASIRYRKARLAERQWHKFVIWKMSRDTVLGLLSRLQGPVMFMRGDGYNLVMIAEDTDRVLFKLLTDLDAEDDRGFGWWCHKKYWCAKTNRI